MIELHFPYLNVPGTYKEQIAKVMLVLLMA